MPALELTMLTREKTKKDQRRPSRRHSRPLRIETLERRALLAAYLWNTDLDGNWDDPANWSGGDEGSIPGIGDTVTIDRDDANPIVSIQTNVRVDELVSTESLLIVGNLHVDGDLTLTNGTSRWQSGSITSESFSTGEESTLTVQAGPLKRLTGDWLNSGSVVLESGASIISTRSIIKNEASGTWEPRGESIVQGKASGPSDLSIPEPC